MRHWLSVVAVLGAALGCQSQGLLDGSMFRTTLPPPATGAVPGSTATLSSAQPAMQPITTQPTATTSASGTFAPPGGWNTAATATASANATTYAPTGAAAANSGYSPTIRIVEPSGAARPATATTAANTSPWRPSNSDVRSASTGAPVRN